MENATVYDMLIKNGNTRFEEFKNLVIEMEFDNIYEGDWAIENSDFEMRMFNSFNDNQKKVYALSLSENHFRRILDMSIDDYVKEFEDLYMDLSAF